ncbi:zinc finger protein 808-like [Lucilia cuprina]|uniref:zinc finger protein 808-like n=1 Tax=Lucilia cuprina TaxID=7375 RepID=UPI001F06FA22|nr:zinc finger protein 808-like [Lucilia cuprina]
MDITIKMETNNIKVGETSTMILNTIKKEEDELIIESDEQWMPIKFEDEQNDYYKEYCQEFIEDTCSHVCIKNESSLDYYKIEYLDEKEYNDDEDDDGESENVKDDLYETSEENNEDDTDYEVEDDEDEEVHAVVDSEGNMKNEYNLQLKHYAKDITKKNKYSENDRSNRNSFTLNHWLLENYIQHICPECNKHVATYKGMLKHIILKHKNAIEEAQNDYVINSENYGTCKKCQRKYKQAFNMYKHSVRHRENSHGLRELKCKMCNYKSTKYIVHRHFVAQHPDIVNEYKKWVNENNTFKCPICHYTYMNNQNQRIWHHFMDKHPLEYCEKFRYNCHLCQHESFAEEQLYLQHLIREHELNCWEKFNFRKLFANKDYLACGICHLVYLRNDTSKLLKHYLEHDNSIYWSCRFCEKKCSYKDTARSSHICSKMISYYARRHKEDGDKKIKNLQEFEEHMAHVCPFCKEDFDRLLDWQKHLRSKHAIDTAKGLGMKEAAAVDSKLHCSYCHRNVANTPVQLHSHHFKHLPFKPYKCRHCQQTLATFKMAVNHVVKRCNDDKDRNDIKEASNIVETAKVEIQCAFCNYQKFADAKEVYVHFQNKHKNFEEFFTSDTLRKDDTMSSCIVCHEKFSQNEQQLRLEHVFTHFDEKIFKCPLCPISYVKLNSCSGHKSKMHNYKPIEKTHISLNDKDKLNKYQRTASISNLSQTILYTEVLKEFAEFISFDCPVCNESLSNQNEWHLHIITQHEIFDKSKVFLKDTNGTWKCQTCKCKLPKFLNRRLAHIFTHMPYRPFTCNLCYFNSCCLYELYKHCRRRHFSPGTFKCPNCPEVLATSHQKTEHLKEKHAPHEWPHHIQCSMCFVVLESESALKRHSSIHDNQRMNCETCCSKSHSKKKEKNKINKKLCIDSSSVSACKVSKAKLPPNVKEDERDLGVGVKSKNLKLSNKRKVVRKKPDVMKVTRDVNDGEIKSEKSNVKKRKCNK